MGKFFRKVHFWKDHRTYLELDGTMPEIARGFPKEGFVVVKIGEQTSIKSAFKLDVDEARALRDQLDTFIRRHDINFGNLLNKRVSEDYTRYKIPYAPNPTTAPPPSQDNSIQQPFFLFTEDANKSETEPNNDNDEEAEFYF